MPPSGSVNLIDFEPSATRVVFNAGPITGAGGRRIECTACIWGVGATYTLLLRSWRAGNLTHVAMWYRRADAANTWIKVGQYGHSHPDAFFRNVSSAIVAPENTRSAVRFSKGWVRWLDGNWHPLSQATGAGSFAATSTDGYSGFSIRHWPQTHISWATRNLEVTTQGWQPPDFPKMTVVDSTWQLWPTFIDIPMRPI
jgi:hypothetical protein